MGMIKEFRDFAVRGNVMDMAVGIIIGAAFGKIVSSMVSDIMMPPIGRLMGSINFSDLYFSLDPEKTRGIESLAKARETGAAIVAYGSFINVILDFLIVAFCVFLMVKSINKLKNSSAPDKPAEALTRNCPYCCLSIPAKATRCGNCTSQLT